MSVVRPQKFQKRPQPAAPAESEEALRLLEAVLFAAAEPFDEETLKKRLPAGADVKKLIATLAETYSGRGVNVVKVAGKWAIRTATDLGPLLAKHVGEPKKLSRAAVETLAIVAYHQPVTRAEIEEIRGVTISRGTLDLLIETGWVRLRGRRRTLGRPVTYGTTEDFLVHFGFEAIDDLPGLEELKARASSKAACRRASACRCRTTTRRCARTRSRLKRRRSATASRPSPRRSPRKRPRSAEPPATRYDRRR